MINNEILSYVDNETIETLEKHIDDVISCWETIKKCNRYPIKRIMQKITGKTYGIDEIDDIMKTALLFHDAGKASVNYQEYLMKKMSKNKETGLHGYRHELISSYIVYNYIESLSGRNEKDSLIIALAVMLHHEPILMDQLQYLRTEVLNADVFFNDLLAYSGMHPNTNELFNKALRKHELPPINFDISSINKKDILKTLTAISVRARNYPDYKHIRLAVGSILIPIVLCDYKVAKNRKGKTSMYMKEIVEVNYCV